MLLERGSYPNASRIRLCGVFIALIAAMLTMRATSPPDHNIKGGSRLDVEEPLVVALVDSGADVRQLGSDGLLWTNEADPVDGNDSDHNGYVDDTHGWDFVENDRHPYDWGSASRHYPVDFGRAVYHGTAIAELVVAQIPPTERSPLKIMPLRVSNGMAPIDLGAIVQALQFALRHDADVIVLALGGSWQANQPLISALDALQHTIVVVAAGNQGQEITTMSPLGQICRRPNLICVASYGVGYELGTAHTASNYGPDTVHLAADGGPIIVHGPRASTHRFTEIDAERNLTGSHTCLIISRHWSGTLHPQVREVERDTEVPELVRVDPEAKIVCPDDNGSRQTMELEGTSIAAARVAGGVARFLRVHQAERSSVVEAFLVSQGSRLSLAGVTGRGRFYASANESGAQTCCR